MFYYLLYKILKTQRSYCRLAGIKVLFQNISPTHTFNGFKCTLFINLSTLVQVSICQAHVAETVFFTKPMASYGSCVPATHFVDAREPQMNARFSFYSSTMQFPLCVHHTHHTHISHKSHFKYFLVNNFLQLLILKLFCKCPEVCNTVPC